jgi:glucose/arabinose dehydrogenase
MMCSRVQSWRNAALRKSPHTRRRNGRHNHDVVRLRRHDQATRVGSIGSNSNAAERGMRVEESPASVWESDLRTGQHRICASGLRNPNGLAWVPDTAALRDGGFYGWPYSYYGQHVDVRVKPQDAALVACDIVPDYALGPRTASLGLAWSAVSTLPAL